MKIKLLYICFIIILLSVSGCNSLCENFGWFCDDSYIEKPEVNTLKDIKDAQDSIEKNSITIKKASKNIAGEANKITSEAAEAQGKIPEESKSKIDSHLNAIKKSSIIILKDTNTINTASAELDGAQSLLDGAGQKVTIVKDALDKITKERDLAVKAKIRAEEQRDSALHKALRWLVLLSIVGAAGCGVFGFMYGNKMSITSSIVCVLIMSIAIFVEVYFIYLVIGGGVLLAGLIGMLIYNMVIQKKAFKEVVETVEVTKSNLTKDKQEELFGAKKNTGIMNSLQSKSTINLISAEKKKISPLWNYAKDKK